MMKMDELKDDKRARTEIGGEGELYVRREEPDACLPGFWAMTLLRIEMTLETLRG